MNICDFKEERFKIGSSQEERKSFYERRNQRAAMFFEAFSTPTLLFAIGFTLCFYKAHIGIMIPVLMVITSLYINAVIKKFDKKPDRFSYICMGISFLIGVSIFLTANSVVIFIDYCIIFLLYMTILLDSFFDISNWSLGLTLKNLLKVVVTSFSFIDRSFNDISSARKVRTSEGKTSGKKLKYVLIGIAISIPVFIVLGVILSTADEVFRDVIGHFFEELFETADIILIPLMALAAYVVAYYILRYICSGEIRNDEESKYNFNEIIGISFMVSILLLYLTFCIIQIRYLFIGDSSLPEGVTYSSYARTGFFQLLFVSVVNVVMVLIIKELFNNSKILNIMLVICCCMTYIIIASAAFRMKLYIDVYYLTFDRLLVLVTLGIIAVVLIGIVLFIINDSFSIYKYCVLSISVCIMIFSFARVDGYIAKYDIERWAEDEEYSKSGREHVDYNYLAQLSLDAAPYITDLIEEKVYNNDDSVKEIKHLYKEIDSDDYSEYEYDDDYNLYTSSSVGNMFRRYTLSSNRKQLQNDNLRNFNISVYRGRKAIDDLLDKIN